MKLLLPDVLRVMEEERLLPDWYALMLRAERYVYESYGDVDEEIVEALFETSREMIEYGFFHLPHPLIWIEDPWGQEMKDSLADLSGLEAIRHAECRKLYLVQEFEDRIEIRGMDAAPKSTRDRTLAYQMFSVPQFIWFDNAKNPADWRSDIGTSITAIKQFVVTLATSQAVRERKISDGYGGSVPKARRKLPYTNVKIVVPSERAEPGQGEPSGPQGKRKLHLVAGYMWGKNTRPKDEQRWIAPFWRGDSALGLAGHSHYEVRARKR